MAIFIGALLALLSIGVVVYPFLRPGTLFRPATPSPDHNPEAADEGPELESIYEAIQTLQLEHQLGAVPQGLYREQMGAYRRQAARALRRRTELLGQDDERVLEQEIMLARASLPPSPAGLSPGLSPGLSDGSAALCPNCGATLGSRLAHCPECSVELGPVGRENSNQ